MTRNYPYETAEVLRLSKINLNYVENKLPAAPRPSVKRLTYETTVTVAELRKLMLNTSVITLNYGTTVDVDNLRNDRQEYVHEVV